MFADNLIPVYQIKKISLVSRFDYKRTGVRCVIPTCQGGIYVCHAEYLRRGVWKSSAYWREIVDFGAYRRRS